MTAAINSENENLKFASIMKFFYIFQVVINSIPYSTSGTSHKEVN